MGYLINAVQLLQLDGSVHCFAVNSDKRQLRYEVNVRKSCLGRVSKPLFQSLHADSTSDHAATCSAVVSAAASLLHMQKGFGLAMLMLVQAIAV